MKREGVILFRKSGDNIDQNNNFETNNNNEIPESVSQRENGTLPEKTGRVEEESDTFRRGIEASIRDAQETKGNLSGREVGEIVDYIRKLGFKPTDKEAEYANGNYIVSDVRPRNVLKDKDGDFYVIDANIERNDTLLRKSDQLEEIKTNCICMKQQK